MIRIVLTVPVVHRLEFAVISVARKINIVQMEHVSLVLKGYLQLSL